MKHFNLTYQRSRLLAAMAFAALLLATGCSGEHDWATYPGDTPTEIIPQASIATVGTTDTRAAIGNTTFPVNTKDIYRVTAYHNTKVPTNWGNGNYFTSISLDSDEAGNQFFSPDHKQYYPVGGSQYKLYFYAYAPAETFYTWGDGATPPSSNWTLTGQQDILWAKDETGIAYAPTGTTQQHPSFLFVHKLKQVRFKIMADAEFEAGVKVTSIKVKGAKNSAALNLATGDLTFTAATGDLSLPITAGINDAITTTGTTMDGSIMFEPGIDFKLEITTSKDVTYTDIAVKLTGTNAGKEGMSHLVTLIFKPTTVTVDNAIVVKDWLNTAITSPSTYPYVSQDKYIVSKDDAGSSAGPFHPDWVGATPVHNELSPLNAVAAKFEVAAEDCNTTNAPGSSITTDVYTAYRFYNAVDACNKYVQDGTGWRLPTIKELIVVQQQLGLSQEFYWSSTQLSSDGNKGLYLKKNGSTAEVTLTSILYVRCVRDIASLPSPPPAAYPYVKENKYIVFDKTRGSYGGVPFHPLWRDATPVHSEKNSFSGVYPTLEVAAENCNATNTPEVAESGTGRYRWADAIAACSAYKQNGVAGWRLPTIKETDVIYRHRLSFTNPLAGDCYYSATARGGDDTRAWYVDFNNGNNATTLMTNTTFVRCVRDIESYPYVWQGKYIVSKDAVGSSGAPIHDNWTGATPDHSVTGSQGTPNVTTASSVSAIFEVASEDCPGTCNWNNSGGACAAYKQDGATWRVPTVQELRLIALQRIHFSGIGDSEYWSSTGYSTNDAYYVVGGTGGIWRFASNKRYSYRVRCVRDVTL